ncbi:AAA family ATPase [Oscillatoria sp. CS-180]|uniref:trifunctional serine/threonine-protein kinase/ATP-binding protein/sensor histidine kinase n=1 Tax=Oscillatoria sp. CS-180 TaxID=3021720 RepID=UPI00232FA3B7|nr:ATP-binding sensor histidine kinase [Oscillatoria sp. CS-180]MDB9527740.1 AAA family ATPase [Oscillatoria sp. CS-180]
MTFPSTTPPTLSIVPPGYTVIEQLHQGSRTRVYRALHTAQQQSVVIKILRNDYPTFNDLVQFRNQYAIAKNLPIPGIVHPISLEPLGRSYALVMEDWGGVVLETYCQQQRLALSESLGIAIQLADILHGLCQNRVVHKDIKPANILIRPDSKAVKLMDFSIASLLPKEARELQSPNTLEGTLAYLAPEQTGRMNRGIDYRADFYALGVTLYQLLTGTLPFTTEDPLELVHCHIAKLPPPIDQVNPEVPATVAAIINTLMAKNAEDRYQSALGLKHDLECCLQQWQTTGGVVPFELRQRDVCDRFLIPEKLYGRKAEVQTLLTAFEQVAEGALELMLVAGVSGIGKTAVVSEIHKPITRRNGYFVKGKFDQFNRTLPFLGFAQALQDLVEQLLPESDAQLANWRTNILTALGESGQVLVDVVPALERIIGRQPPAPDLSGTAAQQRFNRLFQRLIAIFTTAKHPLVLFLDDLQWADPASLQLIKLLMDNDGYLLLIGAYRSNEVSHAHPLCALIEELRQGQRSSVDVLTLSPLGFAETNQLVAEAMHCSIERSPPLAKLINRKTRGNPFFITRLLKQLYEDKFIQFDYERGHWDCDITQVDAPYLTNDVVELIAQQLQRLPHQTQQALKLAACLGSQFDLATLSMISEQGETAIAAALWKALQEEFILPVDETYKLFQNADVVIPETVSVPYKFLHDQVQQAAYRLIPEVEKPSTHLRIGRLIINQLSDSELEPRLFDVVNSMGIGKALITDPSEQHQFVQLLLRASYKAKSTTAYALAVQYCQMGIDMLGQQAWKHQQTLIQELCEVGAEAACLASDFEKSEALTALVLEQVNPVFQKIKSYEIRILSYTIQNRTSEALRIGFQVLSKLNIEFPSNPSSAAVLWGFLRTKVLLRRRSIQSLKEAPIMLEPVAKARSTIIKAILPAAYISAPDFYPLLIFKQIELLLRYGNSEVAPSAYSSYGLIVSSFLGNIEAGYQFGELALGLMENPAIKLNIEAGVIFTVYALIKHWKYPLHEVNPFLFENYRRALEAGENEYAAWSIFSYLRNARSAGMELNENARQHILYIKALEKSQKRAVLDYAYPSYQFTLNLLESQDVLDALKRQGFDRASLLRSLAEADDRSGFCAFYLYELMFAYWLGDLEAALAAISQCRQYLDSVIGFYEVLQFWWFAALTWSAVYSQSPQQKLLLKQIQQSRKKLKKWAHHAPANVRHKWDLIEAEHHRISGKKALAADLYDQAIRGAKTSGYIQEEALANELAAKFYLEWGKENAAAGYMQSAYYGYAYWGAKAKTKDLEKRYPQLLQPVLQQTAVDPFEALATIAPPSLSVHSSAELSQAFGHHFNSALDFTVVLKSSQALSKLTQLDDLLWQLTQTMLQSSGGDRCVLALPSHQDTWQVRAIATPDCVDLCAELLVDSSKVPAQLMHFVKNTREVIAIDNLTTDLPFVDDYLTYHQPQSVVCLPMLHHDDLVGVLYLHNQLTRGAFTSDRILVLNFLCVQAAIALENAHLYQQAQRYSQQLEQSQLRIIQSQKMASLGNMVAGVAHEINNPAGFLNGSINNAKSDLHDLLAYIELYQHHHPEAAYPVQNKAEAIDLDFLKQDFPKLLTAMQGATDRIKAISNSLRVFSRADAEHQVSADLHEGLDSTLLILKYRLKDNERRPAIEVIRQYGDLPVVKCFPGQLNQVFMNILANAIDDFDEAAQSASIADLEMSPQRIMITTALKNLDTVEVRIRDNSRGMSEDVQKRIFDHLYTTKGTGKGTGLGLTIARQIIVDKHHGSLTVQSEPGQGTEFCIGLPVNGRGCQDEIANIDA